MGESSSQRVRALFEEGQAKWPQLDLDAAEFTGYLLARLGSAVDPEKGLLEVHATDLYLACACAAGNSGALSLLEDHYLARLGSVIARVDDSTAFIDEVKQALRQKLLLPRDGAAAKIGDYSGRGSLIGWLRTAAVRTALNLKGTRHPALQLDPLEMEAPLAAGDVELELLKRRYHQDFNDAFRAALGTLDSKERGILRLHVLEGLNVAKIGAIYQVNRTTVVRWVAQARRKLFAETRCALEHRLGVRPSELDSLMRLVRGQLEVSLTRFLAET